MIAPVAVDSKPNSLIPGFQKATPRVMGEKLIALGFVHMTGLYVSKNMGPPTGYTLVPLRAPRECAGTWTRLCGYLIVAVIENGEVWVTSYDPAFPVPNSSVTGNMLSVMCPRGEADSKILERAWADFLVVQGSPKGIAITGEKILARMRNPYCDTFGDPAAGFAD